MTKSDTSETAGKTLYAKFPRDYEGDYLSELKEATALSFEVYGDRKRDQYWCDTQEEAEEVVNNKHLRNKKD